MGSTTTTSKKGGEKKKKRDQINSTDSKQALLIGSLQLLDAGYHHNTCVDVQPRTITYR